MSPFDRADDDLADRLRAGLGEQGTQDLHAFIAFAASNTSGTKRMPSRKSMPTMRMPSTRALSTLSGSQPRARKVQVRLDDLILEPVVEVVVDLLGELVVIEALEVERFGRILSHHAVLQAQRGHGCLVARLGNREPMLRSAPRVRDAMAT